MYNRLKCGYVLFLVKCDHLGRRVLNVSDSTAGKTVPLNFEFAEHTLQFFDNPFYDVSFASDLEILDMFGHHCYKLSIDMLEGELLVN